ncbi:MAG: exodeoxyribonuclease VII small subunit [Deltaproteobacteria bacterium]|nr:MAG: exodeoxyribonuclease VII small subunit [Deltaproteobacteria bacterium]
MEERSFEQSLRELEEIVEELERGDLPLEEALRLFEKGVELSRICHRKLDEVKRRVEILMREGERLVSRPFEEEKAEDNRKLGEDG